MIAWILQSQSIAELPEKKNRSLLVQTLDLNAMLLFFSLAGMQTAETMLTK
jgi:hypothetical protein